MDSKIDKSLKYSVRDAAFWAIMAGAGESYLSAFGVFLKATAFQISLLASVPQLIGSSFQLFATKINDLIRSRKKVVLIFVSIQALVWPLLIASAFYYKNIGFLLIIVTLYYSCGMMAGPAWTSWMGDLVSKEFRGKYFGNRARITSIIIFISSIVAGLILDHYDRINSAKGFAIIFLIAFIGRIISIFFISLKYEPIVELHPVLKTGFKHFILGLRHSNFGIFTFFISMMIFSVNISGPLFILFWLNYLNFNYVQYMLIIGTEQIITFIMILKWGNHIDIFGNKTILFVSSFFVAIIPLAWFMIQYIPFVFMYAIMLQMLSGFAWAGFNLSSSNYIYDSVQPSERISLFSYYIMLRGVALFIGSMIGPLLMSVNLGFANPFFFVLLISFIFRALTLVWFSTKINDIEIKNKNKFIYFASAIPLRGIKLDVIYGLNRTIKKSLPKIWFKQN